MGMFATRDIKYGEELSFDYKSVTESQKEYDSAICLCGTYQCKGYYLHQAFSKKFGAVTKEHHTFVDRNYLIWYASTSPQITLEDREVLHRNGIRSSILTPDVPDWLTKWTSLILRFCEYECANLPKYLKQMHPTYTDRICQIEAKEILSNRINNIAITLDKVKHCLDMMGTSEPPLRTLRYEEMYKRLCQGDNCFKKTLYNLIENLEEMDPHDREKKKVISQTFWELESYSITVGDGTPEEEYKRVYKSLQQGFERLSVLLRNFDSKNVFTEGLADTLYLYSQTEVFFTPNENYTKVQGEEVRVRKCEVTCDPRNRKTTSNPFESEEERVVYKGCKEYDPTYIWGQLVGWHKQTVDKPNASLSADRRGTLCFPDLESFDYHVLNEKKRRPTSKKKNEDYAYNVDDYSDDGEERRRGRRSRSNLRRGNMSSEHLIPMEEVKRPSRSSSVIHSEASPSRRSDFSYPWKKHNKRGDFFRSWKNNFSKQWDVVGKWNFKNTKKMFGSLQFESLVRNGLSFEDDRLTYFREVVDKLRSFSRDPPRPMMQQINVSQF